MTKARYDPDKHLFDPDYPVVRVWKAKDGKFFLPLCQRGPHTEQIHHQRYGGPCDCPCHGRHVGEWWTGGHR